MLSEYFVKKFECIINETTLVIAPEATNRFYLRDNYTRVGASWMTKLDKEQEINDNILFLDKLFSINFLGTWLVTLAVIALVIFASYKIFNIL